jgi:predicted acetyltransferase
VSTDDAVPFTTHPEDTTSVANLAAAGLRYSLVDTTDTAAFSAWVHADDRGFLQGARSAEKIAPTVAGLGYRRTIGVYDDRAEAPAPGESPWPVATVNSWPGQLTLPGSSIEHPLTIASWAISSVTVAPTHRRRGIARNLLEGELRTAAALGIPLAMLTVSESTIYGRFGFAPAAFAADWTIDTRRARWIGPETSARVEFTSTAAYREEVEPFYDRLRLNWPGAIDMFSLRWDQLVGAAEPDSDRTKSLRALRVRDGSGAIRGLALYRVSGGEKDFAQHTVTVERLDAETTDAEAALWRFLLELDLTIELTAPLRRVDEPVRWQIADFRAAKVETWEHQYLRVLDVPAAFEARGYLSTGSLALLVRDPLGFADGTWLLAIDSADSGDTGGRATVTRVQQIPHGIPALALTANELAALYLGGVSATTLIGAGRITELTAGAAVHADGLLRSERAPWLSVWY